jgi:WD40 repeat protein
VGVWDANTGQQVGTLDGHNGTVQTCAWSPDGALLATASNDTTASVW